MVRWKFGEGLGLPIGVVNMVFQRMSRGMNLLRIKKRPDSPPGGFIYAHETGHRSQAWDKETMLRLAKDYRRVNNLPIPDDFEEQAIHQLCTTLPPDWCEYSQGGSPADFIDVRLTMADVLRGTLALAEVLARRIGAFFVPGFSPYVLQEEAEARAATCSACYVKVQIEGCASCSELFPIISRIIGDKKTKSDHALLSKACAICKCSAVAQVHLKPEILARNVTDTQLAQFSQIPHCWKFSAVQSVRAKQLDETPDNE
jgi:hypothetical protein